MKTSRLIGTVFLLVWILAGTSAAERLTVGSKAPPIDIEHWLTDKEPVTKFRRGHVYVIEFWATWCGPCVSSIPHLRDLQLRHGRDVTIISVSDESREKIEAFLERESNGTTFGEMTSHYWLATDPDGSVKQDYMRAAEQRGIPTAFVVGKRGEIEWIGHPMNLDEPLAQILNDAWDRDAYAREMQERREVSEKLQLVFEQARQKKYPEALASIDTMLAGAASPKVRQGLETARQRIKAESEAAAEGPPASPARREAARIDLDRLAIGDQVTIEVTGRADGAVWGDAIYTLDSDIGTAAVHAGLVRVGETKPIKIWVVPSPSAFASASRNGVRSSRWGPFHAAYFMQAATPPAVPTARRVPVPPRVNVIGSLKVGETTTLAITGRDTGSIWGTDQYTGDSSVEAAAVHAGALKAGEQGDVVVTRVPPKNRFEGSTRNGVRSRSWGSYPTAFTVERKSPEAN